MTTRAALLTTAAMVLATLLAGAPTAQAGHCHAQVQGQWDQLGLWEDWAQSSDCHNPGGESRYEADTICDGSLTDCVPNNPCQPLSECLPDVFDCSDGRDNEGDGLADYPDDPDCNSPTDLNECPGTRDYADPDNDGEANCIDEDDDGDLLSDLYEDDHQNTGYDKRAEDADGDGIRDGYDVLPGGSQAPQGARAIIDHETWDPADQTDCDGWPNYLPDPYIDQFKVSYGAETDLATPAKWTQDDHWHDDGNHPDGGYPITLNAEDHSGSDGDVTQGVLDLPGDIRDYPATSTGELPSVTLTISVMDHDGHVGGGGDNPVDLADGSGEDAVLEYPLTDDSGGSTVSSRGSDSCNAEIAFSFDDNLTSRALRTAVYHANHPSDLVEPGDV